MGDRDVRGQRYVGCVYIFIYIYECCFMYVCVTYTHTHIYISLNWYRDMHLHGIGLCRISHKCKPKHVEL